MATMKGPPDRPASYCVNCGKRIWIGHSISLITLMPNPRWTWVHLGAGALPAVGCRAASYQEGGKGWNERLPRWWKATPPVDEDELEPWLKAGIKDMEESR
jgi:hypothetical protein